MEITIRGNSFEQCEAWKRKLLAAFPELSDATDLGKSHPAGQYAITITERFTLGREVRK
jgi:hypothetical protein